MSEIGRDPKRIAAIAMFSFLIATAGFFNTFDLSSGKIAPTSSCNRTNGKCDTVYCTTNPSPPPPPSPPGDCANGSGNGANYCPSISSVDSLNPCHTLGTTCYSAATRTTTFTTTSITFATVLSGAAWFAGGGPDTCVSSITGICRVSFDYSTNSLTGSAFFEIAASSGGTVSTVYQYDDADGAVANSRLIASFIWLWSAGSIPVPIFKARVSVNTITLSVYNADLICSMLDFGGGGVVQ